MVTAALSILLAAFPADPVVIPLWSGGAPGNESRRAEAETKPNPWSVGNIQNPTLTMYTPEKPNGTAVVIVPGGGHRELVVGAEGTTPALFFNKLGVTAFVLKHRLAREAGMTISLDRETRAEGVRAMRIVRSRAKEWGIDPARIGMMGFSAGGEVLSMTTFGPTGDPLGSPDAIDSADHKPNFAIWIYPGPLGVPAEAPVNPPPAFMLVAQDDGAYRVILDLAAKYRTAKVSAEVHVLNGGGHGFNMGERSKLLAVKTWPQRLADWLTDRGLVPPL